MNHNLDRTLFWRMLMLAFWGLAWMPTLRAQIDERESAFSEAPFAQWLAEGPRAQLPWKTHIFPAQLSLHQRLSVRIQAEVDGNELLRRCCDGRAVALLQITDQQGRIYQNHAIRDLKDATSGMSQYMVHFSWSAFVLPGDYQVALALYYSGRPEHSVALERLHVSPLKNDPLAGSWRDLPPVEFSDPDSEGMDDLFLPGVTGRLHLPVTSRGPVRVEVLENLTPYRIEQRRAKLYRDRLSGLLAILKTFGQLDVRDGTLDVATLDFTRSRTTFEQDGLQGGDVNWERLREALVANDPSVIDVHDLRDDAQYAVYFRKEMTRRLSKNSNSKNTESGPAKRVFIVISGPIGFGFGKTQPIAPPADANFVLYYLRYEVVPEPAFRARTGLPMPGMIEDPVPRLEQVDDSVGKMLKDLKPRTFGVHSAEGLRKALAAILEDISKM